jgi:hypothetical protein
LSEAELGILATKLEALEQLMVEKFKGLETKLDLVTTNIKNELDNHVNGEVDWQEEIGNRVDGLEKKPGIIASKTLKWVAGTIGFILIGGMLSLVVLGMVHTLEATPNIGNHIDLPQDRKSGVP